MPVGKATTVGPISEGVRTRLKNYRDSEGHPNYNSAVDALLTDEGY